MSRRTQSRRIKIDQVILSSEPTDEMLVTMDFVLENGYYKESIKFGLQNNCHVYRLLDDTCIILPKDLIVLIFFWDQEIWNNWDLWESASLVATPPHVLDPLKWTRRFITQESLIKFKESVLKVTRSPFTYLSRNRSLLNVIVSRIKDGNEIEQSGLSDQMLKDFLFLLTQKLGFANIGQL